MDQDNVRKLPTKKITNLEKLKAEGIPIYYARFHQAVPPAYNKEPVNEFKLEDDKQTKYVVDSMYWVPGKCIVFEAYGETDATEAANIVYVRVKTK